MNVNKVLTKDYENKTLGQSGKNEPKTNPIKANLMPKQTQSNPMLVRHQCGGSKAKKCVWGLEKLKWLAPAEKKLVMFSLRTIFVYTVVRKL
ncbi:MAG: hypothetical protein FVQ85_21515 [Planctomycetes bacterium]|nr:hypothetical protein [Planctomycetota bacterium]